MIKRVLAFLTVWVLLLNVCACGQSTSGQAGSGEQLTWQEQYDLGVRYLEDGDYEEAIIAFTAAIEIDPKRAEAYTRLAEVYLATDELERAAEVLEQGVTATGDEGLQARLEELREPKQTPEPEPGPESEPAASELRTERKDNGDGSYYINYFNAAGRLIRVENYDPNGEQTSYSLFYFNEAGNLTRQEQYKPNGEQTAYHLYYYDEAENRIRKEEYFPNGTLQIVYFGETGNQMRRESYNPDGSLLSITYYDETGNQTRYETYHKDGTMWEITEY